ncbi:unnamed protein product [Tetraodon nigroviridis]|uniref:(spotted green pufferfish) hypothetical protein n=1 Tax=Tetraodon nigroviridis TaxID=99883 RepID=Q4SDY1_TETNG|nr:unnamed protein product [Tetraodon nigroviridis]
MCVYRCPSMWSCVGCGCSCPCRSVRTGAGCVAGRWICGVTIVLFCLCPLGEPGGRGGEGGGRGAAGGGGGADSVGGEILFVCVPIAVPTSLLLVVNAASPLPV